MTRTRFGSWILGVVVLLLLVSRAVSAIGPAHIVVHGGSLQSPTVLSPQIGSLVFMWAAGNFYEKQRPEQFTIPSRLKGRPYLEYDVFWGRFTEEELLKPEMAVQHGRLYLATADRPAAVVLTEPFNYSPSERIPGRPVPTEPDGFASGRALTPDETAELVAAGIPAK
jgi:hypothetical protein